ncbi:MAG: hypothetical protein ACUVX9_02725 [Anaerolineae bacterium]
MLGRQSLAIVLLLAALSLLPAMGRADEPVVRAVLYYSETCPHCQAVLKEVLPPLQAQYGPRLDIRLVEISAPENYQALLEIESLHGVPPDKATVPEIFVGDRILYGEAEIRAEFPRLVEKLLRQGGTPWPAGFEDAADPASAPTHTPQAGQPVEQEPKETLLAPNPDPAIHLAFFYQVGCHECDRAALDLRYIQDKYPQLQVHAYDIKQHAALAEWLGQRNNVPLNKRLTAPAAFVGSDALLGEQVNARTLEGALQHYLVPGSEAYWTAQADLAGAEAGILQRFQSFGALTVVVAGLVDGLNPCAFATIVFFISYLSFAGRKGREILLVGGMFALGVFLTYLGVGVGLLKALAALPFLPAVSRYLYGFTALLCLILAAGSLYDWYQMRRGRPDEMKLKLPTRLRRQINRVIREGANVRAIAGVALVTGVVISLIELACTGQVYLPTIIFVLGVPALRARGLLYLLLYNVLFVLPLVVVFVLAYWGTTSERLGQFVNKRTGVIKLATAGLFVLLGVWMVAML